MIDPALERSSADVLAEGHRRCARLTRRHGTTYYWGARLLPREQRRDVFAVYGLARTADDLVDEPGERGAATVAAALHRLEADFLAAVETGRASDPVVLAAATTTRDRRIPLEGWERFFAAMRQDLHTTSYATWADLLGYMDGSAAAIGDLMVPVLGAPAAAAPPARALGLAFQLTNFLRDVGEDLDRGRVYVPQEDLDHFGADPHRRVVDDAWRALMRFEVARNRRLYREADDGLTALPPAARRCVTTARLLYARILERIEARDHDVFTGRARVPTRQKVTTAARVLRSDDPAALALADRAVHPAAVPGPERGWADDDEVVLLDPQGAVAGTCPKSLVHHDDTPIHLGFSCYVVDPDGRVLVTVRAYDKASFPGVVTNSACGHPRLGEPLEQAVRRRLSRELGIEAGDIDEVVTVLPDFVYRARSATLVEHERCPVLRATVRRGVTPALHPGEVAEASWWSWADLVAAAADAGSSLSPWCREQVRLLDTLGGDPRAWPPGDDALLPAAARGVARGREVGDA